MRTRTGARGPSGRHMGLRWLQDATRVTGASRAVERVLGVDRSGGSRAGSAADAGADPKASATKPSTSVADQVSSALRSNATCSICMDILAAPHRNFCGHTFCGACLGSWAEKGARLRCPVCRKRLRDVVPDRALEGFIDSLSASGLSEEELASLKDRTSSWGDVKDSMYESWTKLGIKLDSCRKSSFDDNTEDSEDGDDHVGRGELFDDPNDEWDYDVGHRDLGGGITTAEILLTDSNSDDDESDSVGQGVLDWTSPMAQSTAEWTLQEPHEAVDPDLEVDVLTDKEEQVVDGEQTGEWDRPFADPLSTEDWNLDSELEAVNPCADAGLVPELLCRRLENMYEQTVDGWLYGHEGEADPESDGETASSSAQGEPLRSGVCRDGIRGIPDHCVETPSRYTRVLHEVSDEEAGTSSDSDHTRQDYPSGSEEGLFFAGLRWHRALLDFPWQCEDATHDLGHSLAASSTSSEQGGHTSNGGQPSEWGGLYDAGSEWRVPDFDAIDPGLDSEEGNGRSDGEDCPSDGENAVERSAWDDQHFETGATLEDCGFEEYEGELFGESCSDPSRDSDCESDDVAEVADITSSLGQPSHYEESEPED